MILEIKMAANTAKLALNLTLPIAVREALLVSV